MKIGILLAAGKGSRMGTNTSKQYIELMGKPIINFAIEIMVNNKELDRLVFVVAEGDNTYFEKKILQNIKSIKPYDIVIGGETRQESVYNALSFIENIADNETIILIHDAARPMIKDVYIKNCIEAAHMHGAASLGMPVKDTIKVIDKEGYIVHTPAREQLWLTQTPQAFKWELLMEAHTKAKKRRLKGTDDASLVEMIGVKVKMLEGSYENIKITTSDDLNYAKILIQKKMSVYDL